MTPRPQSLFSAGSQQGNVSPLHIVSGASLSVRTKRNLNIRDPDLSFNRLHLKCPTQPQNGDILCFSDA
jgi:hypothetical protein